MLVAGIALLLGVAVVGTGCGSDGDESRTSGRDAGTEPSGEDGRDSRDGRDSTSSTTAPAAPTTTTTTITTTTTGPGGDPGEAASSLSVTVSSEGQQLRAGTLTCGESSTGTGFLADPATAEAACAFLTTSSDAQRRLVEGPNPGLLCTEIYGGPEVARVQGQVDGQAVDESIDRTDGCGIADWDLLGPLLGVPAY